MVYFIRSWSIMEVGASLTVQWKMSLFSHLLRLPLGFFERRHVGDLTSRFSSIDTIQRTMSTVSISGLLAGVMAIALVGMMWLYNVSFALIAVGVTGIYALLRSIGYRLDRRANEEAIV